jgi:hypothetical protein
VPPVHLFRGLQIIEANIFHYEEFLTELPFKVVLAQPNLDSGVSPKPPLWQANIRKHPSPHRGHHRDTSQQHLRTARPDHSQNHLPRRHQSLLQRRRTNTNPNPHSLRSEPTVRAMKNRHIRRLQRSETPLLQLVRPPVTLSLPPS